jgi:hypothetical protein
MSVLGLTGYLSRAWLYHWDLAWRSRGERERKVARYRELGSYSRSDFYLFEGQTFQTRPIDLNEPADAFPAPAPAVPAVAASIAARGFPVSAIANERFTVTLGLRNDSKRPMFSGMIFGEEGRTFVSHHLFQPEGDSRKLVQWDFERADLPKHLAPGEVAELLYTVKAPGYPGLYEVEFDVVEEGVAWSSADNPSLGHGLEVRPRFSLRTRRHGPARSCLILGSGRSGTSMLAGTLHRSGYYMGDQLFDELAARPANPRGFFEDAEINLINEAIMATRDPADLDLRPGHRWLSDAHPSVADVADDRLGARMRSYCSRTPFCYKDPRFTFTLKAWVRHLPAETLILCVFRHPVATARSIVKECKEEEQYAYVPMSYSRALSIYRHVYRQVLSLQGEIQLPFVFINYDLALDGGIFERVGELLNVQVATDFVDRELRRSSQEGSLEANDRQLYDELCRAMSRSLLNGG